MLKIITGRISSSKTHIIIEEIGKRIKNRQKSILIVPDPVTYNFEHRLCSQLNINGFIDVEVCSFNRLASSMLDYFGKNKKTYLDDSTKAMAMRFCILRCRDRLTIFKSASQKKGFVPLAIKMISTLENCGHTLEHLKTVIEKLDESILKMKLQDMAVLYEEYNKILESGYTDNADKLRTARELLPYYTELKNTVIFIDGFDVFTTSLYNFILGLMEQTDVVIALSSAENMPDSSAYEIHKITFDTLIGKAKENNIPYGVSNVSRKSFEKSPEIHFIEDNFYKIRPDQYKGAADAIKLEYFASPEDEIESIAQKITDGINNNARFKDFSILCNDVKKYSPLINTIFAKYNIPVHTNKKHDITAHPVSMYLFSLLKCAYSGFSTENVLDITLSSFTDLTKDEKDFFVSFINDMGIKGYEIENGLYFDRCSQEKQAEFEVLRKKFVEPVKDFRESILKAQTAREMSACCYDFLEKQGIYKKINKLVDQYEEMQFFELSDITAQLWNKTQQLLEDIAQLSQDSKITVEEFSETLLEGFKASPASTIPSVLDCVSFGDLTSAKEQNPTYTFIVGANDGVIPAVYTDERIVTAAESRLLLDYDLELAHSVETEDARLRYNIYSALCSPLKTLTLSCPLISSNGSALRPSGLFKKFLHLFPSIKEVNLNPVKAATEKLKTPYTIEQTLQNMATDRLNSPEAKALCQYFKETGNQRFEILKKETVPKEIALPKELALKLFLPKKHTSISRLETFAYCPYKHFIEYGLNPEISKEYKADGADLGTMFHSVLERFTTENIQEELTKEDCYKKASDIFDEILPGVHYGAMLSTDRRKAFNNILKTLACESAWKIKEQIQQFKVIGEEISFGYGKYPPIEIKTNQGTLYIKGKIDRADKLDKDGKVYLRIIDYKSGNQKYSDLNVETGTNIQLLIYMDALLSSFKNSEPASAQYMLLAENNKLIGPVNSQFSKQKNAKTDQQFRELVDKAKETAIRLTEDMLNGNIKAIECEKCEYCSYSGICGIKNNKEVED